MTELTFEQRRPAEIGGSMDRRLVQITWQDGHYSEYDFEYLRWNCTCALCRGEGGQPGTLTFTTELTPDQTQLVEMGPVGNYAMMLVWKDGHSSGIYTFEHLRQICPCPECSRRAAESRFNQPR